MAVLCSFLALVAPSTDPDQAAREAFERGTRAYNLQDFPAAIDALKTAYELSGKDELLFNIAQAYRRNGQASDALYTYERFLERVPKSPARGEAQKHVEALRARLETASAAIRKPLMRPENENEIAPDPLPSLEPVAVDVDLANPWPARIAAGSGLIFGALGTAYALSAKNSSDDLSQLSVEQAQWSEAHSETLRRGRRHERVGVAALSIGGALLVGGIVHWLWSR
ncbi:MAG: tetratricopeptide repeat protein [Myxococcota bacterium]